MRKTIEQIILTSAALITLGAGLVGGACKSDYPITPTEQPAIHAPAPNKTTIEETLPPEILEHYKLYAPTATPEEFDNFNSALERSYERVKEVYGAVPNIAVLISPSKSKYDVLTREVFKDLYGEDMEGIPEDRFAYPISHFKISDSDLLVHEISHVVNESLFPTYHSWFDEGMAMYASGEVTSVTSLIDDEKWGPRLNERLDELRTNPESYWENKRVQNPGHAVGAELYTLLILDYGLTPEKNMTALSLLKDKYEEYLKTGKADVFPGVPGNEPITKADIQKAYETSLETDLNHLFSDLIRPGIMRWYSTDPNIAGTKGAEINKTIRIEFLN